MTRTIAITIIAMSLSLTAWADAPFNGLYLGTAGGVVMDVANVDIVSAGSFGGRVETIPGISTFFINEATANLSCRNHGNSGIAEVFVGWGYRYHPSIYFGVRLGANFSNYALNNTVVTSPTVFSGFNINETTLASSMRTKLWNVEYTLDFRPGFVLCDRTMFFGVVGIAVNQGRMHAGSVLQARAFDQTGITDFNPLLLNIRDRQTQAAYRLGFGIEQKISQCFSLHLTYVYTVYKRLSGSASDEVEGFRLGDVGPKDIEASFKSRPKRRAITLGLSYYL